MIDIQYCSLKGSGDTNQDFILCKQLQDGGYVAILADGMGGLQYGEIAAATVAQSIYETLAGHPSVDRRVLLTKAFEQADIAVADKCKALGCKMGAAVAVLYIKDDTAYYAWQGNVRLYAKKEKGIHQLTEDHQKEWNNCTFLTRCVNGRGFRYPISIQEIKISDMDSLFLCSDGFYQSKGYIDSVIREGQLPTCIEDLEDDASCILIQLRIFHNII